MSNKKKDTEVVSKAVFNKLERRLDETKAELEKEKQTSSILMELSEFNEKRASMAIEKVNKENNKLKRKLEEVDAELQKERKKSKQFDTLKALMANGVKFPPMRSKISLKLDKFAENFEKSHFPVFSGPVDLAGFQWKLKAQVDTEGEGKNATKWLGLFLVPHPSEDYKGQYEVDVSSSFRLSNVFAAKDKIVQFTKKFKQNDPPNGWGFPRFIEIQELLDRKNGFVQPDGSIHLKVHFTVEIIKADHLLADVEGNENDGGN